MEELLRVHACLQMFVLARLVGKEVQLTALFFLVTIRITVLDMVFV